MNNRLNRIICVGLVAVISAALAGCVTVNINKTDNSAKGELTILAAASLTDVCDELKGIYEKENSNVMLTFSYASSGSLQTQIEEGAPADIFISAANKQMKALCDEGLMNNETVLNLLENKVVLIVPQGSAADISSYEDVVTDKVSLIGIGEIESVPAGQYAKEIFTSLGIWDEVEKKANYGTDVRAVLEWVESGEVDCGVVYATDALTSDKVRIVAYAPEGSHDPVIYPAGVIKSTSNEQLAEDFIAYLQSEEAMTVFEKYGFSAAGAD